MKAMMSQAEWQVMRVLWAHPGSGSSQIIDFLQADFD
ncbi:BlaI/MecI/CopY family transcriptional regulator, partial [Streptococcus danieliae]|nr:BlaI/MecI/CopY family transcriptional regulator [Streptococcus danieliae]